MFYVILIGALAVFFAFLAKVPELSHYLKISFLLVFFFLALRYNYGNDYKDYHDIFNEVNKKFTSPNLFDGSIYGEVGWLLLCRLFKPFGFFAMIAVLALLNCIVYYKFVKEYVSEKFWWLAVFIYVFNPGFMLVHLSAMRQSLAIVIFIMSIKFIVDRRIVHYFLCIILASFFHNSALILLPVYFLNLWKPKFSWSGVVIVVCSFIALFVFRQVISPYIVLLTSGFFSKYGNLLTLNGAEIGSGIGVVFSALLLVIVLLFANQQAEKSGMIIKLSVISFFFIPLSLMFEMLTRTGMYFLPATIVTIPMTFSLIKNTTYQRIIIIFFVLFTTYQFIGFFQSEVFKEGYQSYQTIIPFLD